MRCAVLAAVLTVATSAFADVPTRTESYGKTIAVVDGVSVATLATGIALTATQHGGLRATGIVAIALGGLGYISGCQVVHHLHDRSSDLAKFDTVVRVLVPALGAGIPAAVVSCPGEERFCGKRVTAIALAGGAGMALASAFDILVLAEKEVPYVAPANGGVVVGIAARF